MLADLPVTCKPGIGVGRDKVGLINGDSSAQDFDEIPLPVKNS